MVGLIYINLKVPYYASTKSFYGLCALVPLCFFRAVWWNVLTWDGNRCNLAGHDPVGMGHEQFYVAVDSDHSAPTHISRDRSGPPEQNGRSVVGVCHSG